MNDIERFAKPLAMLIAIVTIAILMGLGIVPWKEGLPILALPIIWYFASRERDLSIQRKILKELFRKEA
ncbi:hypothetical protein J7L81_03400 [Candidatus Aerophobetes bacterium]|nr:hypothetical protein [Candidatus Aerophobetes bacterium]